MQPEEPGRDDARDGAPRTPKGASPLNGQVPPPERRWKRGQSGNPGGRPKGPSVTTALLALAQTEHNGRSLAELVAERMMKEALAGKFAFLKEVVERLDGKVADKHRIESGGPTAPSGGLIMQLIVRAVPAEHRAAVMAEIDRQIAALESPPEDGSA